MTADHVHVCVRCRAACCKLPFDQIFSTNDQDRISPEIDQRQALEDRSLVVPHYGEVSYRISRKRPDGTCWFLDPERQTCQHYESRSLDCRTWPIIFIYDPMTHLVRVVKASCALCDAMDAEAIQATIDLIRREIPHWREEELLAYTFTEPSPDPTEVLELLAEFEWVPETGEMNSMLSEDLFVPEGS
jgi:Fe-S-cluster containining protein